MKTDAKERLTLSECERLWDRAQDADPTVAGDARARLFESALGLVAANVNKIIRTNPDADGDELRLVLIEEASRALSRYLNPGRYPTATFSTYSERGLRGASLQWIKAEVEHRSHTTYLHANRATQAESRLGYIDEELEAAERRADLDVLMRNTDLERIERQILVLRYSMDMTLEKAAEALHESLPNVQYRERTALTKLRMAVNV